MRFKVFDVGHGFCAYATAQNGNVILFDCGHKANPLRRPSVFLPTEGIGGIEYLFVTNYDEDHISDLPALRQRMRIDWLYRNNTISPEDLRLLKLQGGPLSLAMESLLQMCGTYTDTVSAPPATPGISWTTYRNQWGDFKDANNLSLVTFLDVGSVRFLIPGDLECAGWLALLETKSFRDDLCAVDVMIASHHGREGGYCADVFQFCRPNSIVFSDGPQKYATQEMASKYGCHASGCTFNGQSRQVISTRLDGDVWWNL